MSQAHAMSELGRILFEGAKDMADRQLRDSPIQPAEWEMKARVCAYYERLARERDGTKPEGEAK